MKIGIVGSGVYAMALAMNLIDKNVCIWCPNEEVKKNLETNRSLAELDGITFPSTFKYTTSIEDVMKDKDIIIIATSIVYLEDTLLKLKEFDNNHIYLFATKGILNNGTLISECFNSIFNSEKMAFIGGGTFAIDMASLVPVGLTIASSSNDIITNIKSIFSKKIVFDSTNDVMAIQICSLYKNIMAIYIGYYDGLNTTKSTKALVFKNLIDNLRLILFKLKCNTSVINLYCGISDIYLTCTTETSRNYTFGKRIALKNNAKDYLNKNTVEGYHSILGINNRIDNKILKEIDLIIKKGMN